MNRRTLLFVASLAAFAAVACGGAANMPRQGTAGDEAAIRSLADKYVAAFNANDASGIAALVADDYQAVAPDGTVVMGKSGVAKMLGTQMEMRQKMNVNLTLSVSTNFLYWLNVDSATMGGSWTAMGAPVGSPDRGSWLAVAHKSPDGEWRLVSDLAADYMRPPEAAEPVPAG